MKTADSAAESHQPITQMQTSIIKIFLGKGFRQYVSAEILEGVGDRRKKERGVREREECTDLKEGELFK